MRSIIKLCQDDEKYGVKIIKFPKGLGHLHEDFVFYHITVGKNNKNNGSSRSHNMLNSVSYVYIYPRIIPSACVVIPAEEVMK